MANLNEGAAHDTFVTSPQSSAEDLLALTVALGNQRSTPATSADVIAHPMGGAIRAFPVGGLKKRIFDLVVGTIIVVLAAPLLALVALATASLSEGPVVFAHKRVGFRSREFRCLKFRTMVVDAEARLAEHLSTNPEAALEWAETRKLRRDPRVTWIGNILRKTSLDELPQLFNVLRGDMSLVGPRPVMADELVRYAKHRPAYLSARPGMTGLWQVSGRNTTTYERRAHLDAAYSRNWTLLRDLKILARTIPEMLFCSHTS